jgi:hypothetical protein
LIEGGSGLKADEKFHLFSFLNDDDDDDEEFYPLDFKDVVVVGVIDSSLI